MDLRYLWSKFSKVCTRTVSEHLNHCNVSSDYLFVDLNRYRKDIFAQQTDIHFTAANPSRVIFLGMSRHSSNSMHVGYFWV